jgi:heterodisulfide reductase subunit A-like polyferredoxin
MAETLAKKAAQKILSNNISDSILKVKGIESPYRGYFKPLDKDGKPISILKVKPKTNKYCIDCKICVHVCPMGSIDLDNVSEVNGICIKCCACVKKCPQEAKYFDDPGYLEHLRDLEETYTRSAASEIFY